MSTKRSRVNPNYKTKYRVGNWPATTQRLCNAATSTCGCRRTRSRTGTPSLADGDAAASSLDVYGTLAAGGIYTYTVKQRDDLVRALSGGESGARSGAARGAR